MVELLMEALAQEDLTKVVPVIRRRTLAVSGSFRRTDEDADSKGCSSSTHDWVVYDPPPQKKNIISLPSMTWFRCLGSGDVYSPELGQSLKLGKLYAICTKNAYICKKQVSR